MTIGKAYGLFNCRASKEEIEAELPSARNATQTPADLELRLSDDLDDIDGDRNLKTILEEAKKAGIRFALEATLPDGSNRDTANELSAVLDNTYKSKLYSKGEPFTGQVIYEENGTYQYAE